MGYVEELRAIVGHRPLILVAGVFHVYPKGDQSHPVCVVYTADYPGGPLRLDPAEALQARFFALDALPPDLRKSTLIYLQRYRLPDRHG